VRQIVVESAADPPWEKCARRAVPLVAEDLLRFSETEGRTPLHRAQHIAARRRAEQLAPHVDYEIVLADLGHEAEEIDADRWRAAIGDAVVARSREQMARAVEASLGETVQRASTATAPDGPLAQQVNGTQSTAS
jgi:hypothetical protein